MLFHWKHRKELRNRVTSESSTTRQKPLRRYAKTIQAVFPDAIKLASGYCMPLKLKIGLSSLVLTLLASPGLSADRDDPWQGLNQLRRDVGFVFIERDMTCQYGRIKALTDQNILIKTDQSEVTIDKSSLLRVRLGFGGRTMPHNNPNMPLFTVFSGRSSWEDLLALAPLQSKTHPGFTIIAI
jgi:hypothetical protein